MLGKVVALVLISAAYGVLSLIGSVLVGAVTLQARGAEAFPSAEVLRTLVLSLLVLGLWALIGLGAGILIPNQVAALLIAVGVAWIVEPVAGLAIKQWTSGGSTSRRTSRARRARRSSTPHWPRPTTSGCRGGAARSCWWCGPWPSPASASCEWFART